MDFTATRFSSAKFINQVTFHRAEFQEVYFCEALSNKANFKDVTFNSKTEFMGAKFDEVDFSDSNFSEVSFIDAEFNKSVYFTKTRFLDDAYFNDAIFQKANLYCSEFLSNGISANMFDNISTVDFKE